MAFELKEEGFRLKDIFLVVGIPEATYHYHVKNFGKEDLDTELKELIIHSDQGWHYQHNQWVKTLKNNNIFQSLSHKATCAEKASMENFFGILKQEMYYGEKLVSYEELKRRIEEYINWYNNERSKEKLTGLKPC